MSDDNENLDLGALVTYEQCRMRLPSRPECIGMAAEYLCRRAVLCGACPEKRANKVTMSLHEAISNAIVHGNLELSSALKEQGDDAFAQALAKRAGDTRVNQRKVDVRFDYDGTQCRWTFRDEGPGFDFQRILGRAASDEPMAILSSGRGILIMRSFMDGVSYEEGGRRLLLTMVRKTERRTEERLPLATPVEVAPLRDDGSADWDAAWKTVATNISEGGMALVHEKLVSGERIMISLLSEGRSITVPAEIRHTRSLSAGLVEIGCRFLSNEERSIATAAAPPAQQVARIDDAIGQLLTSCQQEPAHERRVHERATFSECIEVHFGAACAPGYTRNLSKGGVAFLTSAALPSEVMLVFPQRGDVAALRMRAEVVRVTKIRDGLFDVGTRFVELLEE